MRSRHDRESRMSLQTQSALAPMVHKLQIWNQLDSAEQDAVLALPHQIETIEPGAYIVHDGAKAEHSCVLLSGFAFRQKMTGEGGRSISAIHLKGDIVDLQNSLLGAADHSVQALSEAEIARIPLEALGLGDRSSYQFPMTQEQLADVTGLTTVHVNRSLKSLEAQGLLTRTTRYVAVGDWPSLKHAGDFDEAYLHLAMPQR